MTLALTAAGAKVVAPSHIADDIPLIEADVAGVIGNSGGDVHADGSRSAVAQMTARAIIDATVDRFGQVDMVINNAGLGMRPFSENFMTERTKFWEADICTGPATFDTNTMGPVFIWPPLPCPYVETRLGADRQCHHKYWHDAAQWLLPLRAV